MNNKNNQPENLYDDKYDAGNATEVDYPGIVEPLPESTRPRKDGPGGDDGE